VGRISLERAIGFVKAMLALHDKCVVVDHMPMQNDLLVCREFEQYMHIMALFIDTQYRKKQMLQFADIRQHVRFPQ
jgi:hypothetical protein